MVQLTDLLGVGYFRVALVLSRSDDLIISWNATRRDGSLVSVYAVRTRIERQKNACTVCLSPLSTHALRDEVRDSPRIPFSVAPGLKHLCISDQGKDQTSHSASPRAARLVGLPGNQLHGV